MADPRPPPLAGHLRTSIRDLPRSARHSLLGGRGVGHDRTGRHTGSPPTPQPLAEAARAYAARKDSPTTRRAYADDWRLFERWCLRQGLDPLLPDPRIVGLFLAAAADGHGLPQVSVATLERRLAALTTRYRSARRVSGPTARGL